MSRFSEVILPHLGVNEEEALLAEWLVNPGDQVLKNKTIATVETSKATFELEAEEEGFFYPLVKAGTRVMFREPVALILEWPDPAMVAEYQKQKKATVKPTQTNITAKAVALAKKHGIDLSQFPTTKLIREKDVLEWMGRREPQEEKIIVPTVKTVAVYGASQGGLAVVECLRSTGTYTIAGIVDDDPGLVCATYHGLPVWSGDNLKLLKKRGVDGLSTHIMNAKFRMKLRARAKEAHLTYINVIHSSAMVAPTAKLGRGNLVKAGAIVDAYVEIGDCSIIDNGVVLPHHNRIGDGCHISPGVSFGGDCEVGDYTIIGVGAVISPRIKIGSNVIIGVGACVNRDIPDGAVVEGPSGKVIGTRK